MLGVGSIPGRARSRARAGADGARRAAVMLRETARQVASGNTTVAYWWRGRRNFGDEFTPALIRHIAGTHPVHVDDLLYRYRGPVLMGVGSILEHQRDHRLVVWGSGLIGADSVMRTLPSEVRAVRGPLTRSLLLRQGIECPEVYGDPALLYPRFMPRVPSGGYRLGLVPHFVDKADPELTRLGFADADRVIDVQREPDAVVRDICACEAVASSSLHGLIIALAYGIPAVWVEFSDRVIGHGFKFRDFFASIGSSVDAPLRIDASTSAEQLLEAARACPIDLDLDALLAVCPLSGG